MPDDDPDMKCALTEFWDGYLCKDCPLGCLSCDGVVCTACKMANEILVNGICVSPVCPLTAPQNYLSQCVEGCNIPAPNHLHNYGWLECQDEWVAVPVDGDGCSVDCKIEDGFTCFTQEDDNNFQYCEFTDYTEITRIIPSDDNNIIIEFSHDVYWNETIGIDKADIWVTIESDAKRGEFSEPLEWTTFNYTSDMLPTRFLPIKIQIGKDDRNYGPEI